VSQKTWTAVDEYLSKLIVRPDAALDAALADSQAAGLPEIAVSASQGKLLNLLARAMGARRILEIGTLGGYSAIWLARSLPPDGRLISLEYSPKHAQVARANLARAGLAEVSEVRVGAGLDLLPQLTGPFDLFFIDADKTGYPDYFRGCLRLSRPGSVMIFDNMVRAGEIADPASRDPAVRAVRQLYEDIAAEPRAAATAVQTVGSKGYDGFCMVVVSP
jgi:predicted O-methyltransferase YrrM